MNRLVKDGKIILDGTLPKYKKEKLIFEKFEAIENIEEELGIELAILWKAITKGVYACYDIDKEPAYIEPNRVYILKDRLSVGFYPEEWNKDKLMNGEECRWGCLYNKYGITWALTKEELLK